MRGLLLLLALAAAISAGAVPENLTVSGTVIYSQAWNLFFLKTETENLFVATRQGHPELAAGDDVKVTGFPAQRLGRLEIESATYEKLGTSSPLPDAISITPAALPRLLTPGGPDDHYGARVRFTASATEFRVREWGFSEVELSFGGEKIVASMQGRFPAAMQEKLELLPRVEVEGILKFIDVEVPPGESPLYELRLTSPDDVTIVPDATFRRRCLLLQARKLISLTPYVLLLVVAGLTVKLYRAHRAKDRLQAVIDERRRMAADLHDSIEQHLAGARLYLDSLLPDDGSPAPKELKAAELARDILVAAKREIRETIWNLRLDELTDQAPRDVLLSLVGKLNAPGHVQVSTVLRNLPEALPERLFSDLLYIIQEAVTNAIKHGRATRLVLTSDTLRTADGFALRILNNGTPFDPNRALGPEAGHYGLSGMRERARRNGIEISWFSSSRITSVRLEVHL